MPTNTTRQLKWFFFFFFVVCIYFTFDYISNCLSGYRLCHLCWYTREMAGHQEQMCASLCCFCTLCTTAGAEFEVVIAPQSQGFPEICWHLLKTELSRANVCGEPVVMMDPKTPQCQKCSSLITLVNKQRHMYNWNIFLPLYS